MARNFVLGVSMAGPNAPKIWPILSRLVIDVKIDLFAFIVITY